VSTYFFAVRLFCFSIRQHGCQILYFKLHVGSDGCKFHYRRPQVVHRWSSSSFPYICNTTNWNWTVTKLT